MSTVKISAATAVSTLGDSHVLPLGNVGNGEANKVTVATLAQYAAKYCSDINVVFHYDDGSTYGNRSVDLARYLTSYPTYFPYGLELVNCAHPLMVSLTEPDDGTMNWASQSGGTGTYLTTQKTAIQDFDGESKTASIISNCSYANADGYAPYEAYNFSCYDSSHTYGWTSGMWWLPSVGELRMILAKFTAINTALSLLTACDGGWTTTALSRTAYWSSTENSASNAWYVTFSNGDVSRTSKTSHSYKVRPVSIFQNMGTI